MVAALISLARSDSLRGRLPREHVSRASLQHVLAGRLVPRILAFTLQLIQVGRVRGEVTGAALVALMIGGSRCQLSLDRKGRWLSARAAITVRIAHEAGGTASL